MAEFQLIEMLRQRCAGTRADVLIGIGDDAAIVSVPAGHDLVICTDTLVAGVHFPIGTDAPDIGWKCLAVNLSDLAAMGASPAWATLALTLPSADSGFVARFAEGFADLAAAFELALIGGDTTRGPLAITVTAHGFVPAGRALRRDGARIGDVVFVTGTLGDAAAGLRCMQAADVAAALGGGIGEADRESLIASLNRPMPRVAAGLALRDLASACIDVSDGLLADLAHVAKASGIGFEIGEDCLPGSTALFDLFEPDVCREWQMSGGDDYELVFTIAEAQVAGMLAAMAGIGCRVSPIGRAIAGAGVQVVDRNGRPTHRARKGWQHFA